MTYHPNILQKNKHNIWTPPKWSNELILWCEQYSSISDYLKFSPPHCSACNSYPIWWFPQTYIAYCQKHADKGWVSLCSKVWFQTLYEFNLFLLTKEGKIPHDPYAKL